nr:MAG TPA: hypothetical protein [Caudoviricetes sp.]
MEILQTKIYNKTDNFNLTKGQSYPDLKSTFIVHQKDNKHGKIYITDYNGYCIEIFDIELNQKIEDLIRNFDAYKLSVSQQFNQFKSDLQDYAVEKDSILKTELTGKITENKTSLDNLKKKLPKDLKIEGNKLKLILNDDTVLGDITITVSGQNTKIKEFKYDAGVFKIVDTEDNVFPSGINLTQLFAPKNHNHDTEYVKLDDSRITTQYLPLSWNKRNNKEIIKTGDNWLRINEDKANSEGVFFGQSIIRVDNQLQIGEGGDKIKLLNDGTITVLNRTKIVSRNNGDIAFGNNAFNDLVYGEFKGIKIWGNNSDDKVVLAGGGVKNLSDFNFLPLHALNSTNDINTYLSNGKFFVAETYNTQNMPANDYFHIFGGRHRNPNNNFAYYFAIPFNNKGNDNFYFKNRENGLDRTWTKFIGFKDAGGGYQEIYNEHGYAWHFPSGKAFRVYQGDIGSGILKLAVTESEVFSPKRIESDSGFHFRNRSNDDVLLNNGGSLHKDNFFINRGNPYNITGATINTFRSLPSGGYYVSNGDGSGLLLSFVGGGSTSSLEFYKANWYPSTRIGVRNTVDGSRFNDDNGGFRDLAWYDDVIRVGGSITSNWSATKDWQNNTIFIEANCNIELSLLEKLSSISFRKVFNGGEVTFSCAGKTIIYTSSDNKLNGGDGSTAVVSIWNNKCYVDIRNVYW